MTAAATQGIFAATNPADDNHGILLEMGSDGVLRYLHRFPSGASGGMDIYSAQAYNDNTWRHLAAVKSGDTLALDVDGVRAGAASPRRGLDSRPGPGPGCLCGAGGSRFHTAFQ